MAVRKVHFMSGITSDQISVTIFCSASTNIYMSGESHSQEIINAMKCGAVDFLLKTFFHSQLLDAVEKGLVLDLNFRQNEARLS